jgi:hypothetical protein
MTKTKKGNALGSKARTSLFLVCLGLSALGCKDDERFVLLSCERDSKWFCCDDKSAVAPEEMQVIPSGFICDGYPDCGNGRDEVACGGEEAARRRERAESQGYIWFCDKGRTAIHVDFRCDGIPDCLDGSDELSCRDAAMPVCHLPRFCFMCKDQAGNPFFVDDILGATCNGVEECPDGSDETGETCAQPSERTCRACFECESGEKTKTFGQTCDLKQDCEDGSDESALCDIWDEGSPSDEEIEAYKNYFNKNVCMECFPCEDGEKITHMGFRCDLFEDCADGSDEKNCDGEALFFECKDKEKTIPVYRTCNLIVDCADGSDEDDCDEAAICDDGTKIPLHWICDGVPDCANDEDEAGCKQCATASCYLCATLPETHADKSDHCHKCPASDRCSLCADSALYRRSEQRSKSGVPWRCDSKPHCADWSDEIGCSDKKGEVFACETPSFYVPIGRKCDLAPDCPDWADEDPVNCPDFLCDDGTQVAFNLVCNYYADCPDNSDEGDNCFECASQLEKIEVKKRCDGWSDCEDGSDEDGCPS